MPAAGRAQAWQFQSRPPIGSDPCEWSSRLRSWSVSGPVELGSRAILATTRFALIYLLVDHDEAVAARSRRRGRWYLQ